MFKFESRTLVVTFLASLLCLGLVLAGCGGGSGGSGGGGAVGGLGGGKAALTSASIVILDKDQAQVGTGAITNGAISLTITGALTSSSYPLELVASGGQFVLSPTNIDFDGTLRAIVTESTTNVGLTAFTTLHAWIFKRVPGTDVDERYTTAQQYMDNFFQLMGITTGSATLNFLTDNAYAGANSNAYETAQQMLAYMCGYADESTGLDEIDSRLQAFANTYMDGILGVAGDPAANVATQMDNNHGGTGAITNPSDISTRLNSNAVKAQVAKNVEAVFSAATGITGTGTPPTQAQIEGNVSQPATFLTTPMAITGNSLTGVQAGAATTGSAVTGALTIEDATGAAMAGENMVISWDSSYSISRADFVVGGGSNIANGGTLLTGNSITVNYPAASGTYIINVAAENNPYAKFQIIIEVLGSDSIAVTGVTLQNGGSATSTDGITFETVPGTTRPGLIAAGADNVFPADISSKLRAVIATTVTGSGSGQYYVNFKAPTGIRFVRGSGNYPNYMVTTSAISATGTTNVAMPATEILANQNVTAGLKDFSVDVICMTGGSVLASDSLNNGMYLINDAHQTLIAKVQGFNFGGNTSVSSANLSLNGAINGVYRTWGSLAGTSTAVNGDPTGYYGAPKLVLMPGSATATAGLTLDGSVGSPVYANDIATGFTIAGKSSTVQASDTGGANWYLKPTTGANLTNDAKMWLVIPALDSADSDIVSANPVTVTAP